MIRNEDLDHIFAGLRRGTGGSKAEWSEEMLRYFEQGACELLNDVDPPVWDDCSKKAYAYKGVPLLPAKWDLYRAESEHGVGHLLSVLKPQRDAAFKKEVGEWTKKERNARRWYPAAELMRHCLLIRQYGWTADRITELQVLALKLTDYETELGRKKRAISRIANDAHSHDRQAKRERTLAAMENRIERGQTVPAAARDTFKLNGLGTSAGANEKLWRRYRK